jgi:predicted molibdopterin-dependent oxidoreductase YjgC
MNTNNIDRYQTTNQAIVGRTVEATLGRDVANTNSMQELLSDVKMQLVVGPDLGKTAPVASYWFYHSRLYREAKTVVISLDEYPLAWRGELWLKPNSGTTATLLNGIARQVVELGLAAKDVAQDPGFSAWQQRLVNHDIDSVSKATGISAEQIKQAATLYATGGAGMSKSADAAYPAALIYQTVAHQIGDEYGDAAEISAACNNLAILTGNFGRGGGGVASLRGDANSQGAYDMGATPSLFAGGASVEDARARAAFENAWLPRWAEKAKTSNGFVPVRTLPAKKGKTQAEMIAAIERGEITAMVVDGRVAGRNETLNAELEAALAKLQFLVVFDAFDSPLAKLANIVLPKSMSLEKDGTFTSFDRTVQRVRAAVPALGEAISGVEFISRLSNRLGYGMNYRVTGDVMNEIAKVNPDYAGVTYARLERGGISVPVASYAAEGNPILQPGADGRATISPRLAAAV